eukprot:SAG31_NODE_8778_length_1389_cov_0.865891_3_plen_53_part_00
MRNPGCVVVKISQAWDESFALEMRVHNGGARGGAHPLESTGIIGGLASRAWI